MAPKASMSLLFHPKKGAKQNQPPPARKPSSQSSKPLPKPEEDDELKLPDGPYQEFRLLSSALNGWKYDVMKFESRKPVDISKWTPPIKLNRKDLRREEPNDNFTPEAVKPMVGLDGKPVIGSDGRVVMVDAEGRPIHSKEGGSPSSKDKGKGPGNRKRFQKKTKQVFLVSEELRQLRREERYPWVMEDSSPSQNEVWIGQMEEVKKSETHAFFMPAANDIFKFVPAHRWYKFQKKLKHDFPTDTANVESLYTLSQKRDPQAFLTSRKGGVSSATAAMFKAEAEGRSISIGNSLVHDAGQSLGPGGRRLKTVDSGMSGLFDDDDNGDSKRQKEKEYGGEGDLDEQVYEEEFADDEEKMDMEDNDEEAKEIEERLKREYKTANKQRDTGVDDDDDDGDDQSPGMSKQAKAMQKLIRNREGNEAYDSDEEKNPYASSEEEEEEEEVEIPAPTPPVPQPAESRSQTPITTSSRSQPNTNSDSQAPAAAAGLGGHSIVAKRATSPKAPKPKTTNGSRANSPLGSRANSPVAASRGSSPTRPESPTPANGIQKLSNKRKAEDIPSTATSPTAENGNSHAHKMKKRKPQPVPGAAALTAAELETMLVGWLTSTPNATTRDCIHHFTPYLTDVEKKQEFSSLVKKVAQLKGGVLVLRNRVSAAPSPASAT